MTSSRQRARRIKLKSLEHALIYYRSRHQSKGCIVTHMIGVPMLVLAPLALWAGQRKAAWFLLANGLFLQWLGHAAFEKNKPSLVETRSLLMIPAALIFVTEKWKSALTGRGLLDTTDFREELKRKIQDDNEALEEDSEDDMSTCIAVD